MDSLEKLRALIEPLSPDEIETVMTMFRNVLEAMPSDEKDASDGPLRARIETLLLGFEAGRKR